MSNQQNEWKENCGESLDRYGILCDKVYRILHRLPTLKEERGSNLYTRIFCLVDKISERREEQKNALGWSEKDYKNKVDIGRELKTDQRIVSAGILLAYENPVLILAIDKDLFAEARVWFNTSKEINEKYSKDGQIPIPSHSISFYGLRFKESDGFYYPKTITLNQWAAVSALQTPVL